MISGIYKITNIINNNAYIGLSIDVYGRWSSHKQRALKYSTGKEYDKVLYRAMRKYGIENFTFEVIEECPLEQLAEREKYWIAYFDTYHNGYNQTTGGEVVNMGGELHPNHKLNEDDVIEIRLRWASCTISTRELYYDYKHKIGKSGFKKIYSWQTWKNILPELNTQERRDWHRLNSISYANIGDNNTNSKITEQEFVKIIERRSKGESFESIYADYKNIYSSLQSFKSSYYCRTKTINKYTPVSTISVVGE